MTFDLQAIVKSRALLAVAAVLYAMTAAPAHAAGSAGPTAEPPRANADYRFTIITAPGAITFTGVLGINNRGDIVGVRDGLDLHSHGFVRKSGGRFITIDYPGATDTAPSGITDDGMIVGTYFDTGGFQHGFILRNGQWTTLDVPGAAFLSDVAFEYGTGLGTAAFRVNNAGVVVGQWADPAGYSHGFRYQNGTYQTVDVAAASHGLGLGTQPLNIDNSGVIAGGYYTDAPTPAHCFVGHEGAFMTLDFPGAAGFFGTQCNGTNVHGVIVGPYSDAKDHIHGFIWRNGQFSKLDVPLQPDSETDGINDHGVIFGQYTSVLKITRGYVATPRIPE